jgi:predicted TIM-barrel enzyme
LLFEQVHGSSAHYLEESLERVQAMHGIAKAVNTKILVLCQGGPINTLHDAAHVQERTPGVAGFFDASSVWNVRLQRSR